RLAPGPPPGVAMRLDHGAHRAALGHAAADEPLDPVPDHEVEAARRSTLDGLPALHGVSGPRHQREICQVVAAIGHARRDRVVLALVREHRVLERLEDDRDLLLEELAVGRLVEQRRAERVHLARVIAAADAEAYPAAG